MMTAVCPLWNIVNQHTGSCVFVSVCARVYSLLVGCGAHVTLKQHGNVMEIAGVKNPPLSIGHTGYMILKHLIDKWFSIIFVNIIKTQNSDTHNHHEHMIHPNKALCLLKLGSSWPQQITVHPCLMKKNLLNGRVFPPGWFIHLAVSYMIHQHQPLNSPLFFFFMFLAIWFLTDNVSASLGNDW